MADNVVSGMFGSPEPRPKDAEGHPSLKSGGDGPYNGDMEHRIKNLETSVTQMAMDLSYIRGKTEDAPTKDWITTRLIAIIGAFSTLLALIGWIIAKTV